MTAFAGQQQQQQQQSSVQVQADKSAACEHLKGQIESNAIDRHVSFAVNMIIRSGTKVNVRIMRPGDVVTTDYSSERLNLELAKDSDRVARVGCF